MIQGKKIAAGGELMESAPKILTEEEKKKLAEEFIAEVEARLKKEEKHLWMVKDHEHLHQNE